MYANVALLVLAASSASASIVARQANGGWSLQASSAPAGTTDCGNGSYCPSSMHCNIAANLEVAACCPSTSDCRGAVEGSPVCADAAWSLFKGLNGNGFCCEVGKVGVMDYSQKVAGTCADSADGKTTAQQQSTGTGSVTKETSSASAAASTTAATTAAASSSKAASSASPTSASAATGSASGRSTSSAASASASSASSAAASSSVAGSSSTSSGVAQASASGSAAFKKDAATGFGFMAAIAGAFFAL